MKASKNVFKVALISINLLGAPLSFAQWENEEYKCNLKSGNMLTVGGTGKVKVKNKARDAKPGSMRIKTAKAIVTRQTALGNKYQYAIKKSNLDELDPNYINIEFEEVVRKPVLIDSIVKGEQYLSKNAFELKHSLRLNITDPTDSEIEFQKVVDKNGKIESFTQKVYCALAKNFIDLDALPEINTDSRSKNVIKGETIIDLDAIELPASSPKASRQ